MVVFTSVLFVLHTLALLFLANILRATTRAFLDAAECRRTLLARMSCSASPKTRAKRKSTRHSASAHSRSTLIAIPITQRLVGISFYCDRPSFMRLMRLTLQIQPQSSTNLSLLKNFSLIHYEELNSTHHYENNAHTRKSMRDSMQSGRLCKTILKNANGNLKGQEWIL